MSLISYIFPRVVARYSTKYNHDIRVLEENGKYKLLANGSRQSGEYVKKLWEHALCTFEIFPTHEIRNALVLGVAGGDVIHMIHAMYPDSKITGVDIDSRMIEIGRKHFRLNKVQDLTLVVEDAKNYIRKTGKWDIILCDTHIGATVPPFIGEEGFLESARRALAPGGVLIINYLREFEYEKLSDLLLTKLRKTFPHVRDTKIYFNRFFFCM